MRRQVVIPQPARAVSFIVFQHQCPDDMLSRPFKQVVDDTYVRGEFHTEINRIWPNIHKRIADQCQCLFRIDRAFFREIDQRSICGTHAALKQVANDPALSAVGEIQQVGRIRACVIIDPIGDDAIHIRP